MLMVYDDGTLAIHALTRDVMNTGGGSLWIPLMMI
jgi:hypothetical protein